MKDWETFSNWLFRVDKTNILEIRHPDDSILIKQFKSAESLAEYQMSPTAQLTNEEDMIEQLQSYQMIQSCINLREAESGDPASSYTILSTALNEIKNQLSWAKARPDYKDEYCYALEATKYLGRCLERVLDGVKPDEAFHLKLAKGGGGRPTPKKLKERSLRESKEYLIGMYISLQVRNGETLDDASEKIAEKLKCVDKSLTYRACYTKNRKLYSSSRFYKWTVNSDPNGDGLLEQIRDVELDI